jgi:DNA primase
VGFAPKSFDALKNALTAQGFTLDELTGSGLLSTGERGNSYDRFRGRVMWPIRDVTGQTIGFGARKLFDDDQGPKYLNTPETLVFHKSQVLYGLDLARRDVAKGKQIVIVEGYTDVMACHLAGVTTAVATCGTAFGVEHIKVVRRVLGDYANADVTQTGEVVFTFDPDEAGQRAASRAFAEEQRFAAQTFVAVPPEGLDPCDLRIERGDEAVRKLVADRKPMFEFMVRRQLAGHDLETVEGRVAALRASAPVVAGIRDRAMRGGYVRNLAGWLGMDHNEVGRAVTGAANQGQRADSRGAPRGDNDAWRPDGAPASAPEGEERPRHISLTELPTDPVTRMERDALMAMLQYPQSVGPALMAQAVESRFTNQTLAVVRDGIRGQLDALDSPEWLQRVGEEVPQVFASLVTQLGIAPIPEREQQMVAYCRGVVTSLVDRDLLRRKGELLGAMQRARAEGDTEREATLGREAVALESARRELRGE